MCCIVQTDHEFHDNPVLCMTKQNVKTPNWDIPCVVKSMPKLNWNDNHPNHCSRQSTLYIDIVCEHKGVLNPYIFSMFIAFSAVLCLVSHCNAILRQALGRSLHHELLIRWTASRSLLFYYIPMTSVDCPHILFVYKPVPISSGGHEPIWRSPYGPW